MPPNLCTYFASVFTKVDNIACRGKKKKKRMVNRNKCMKRMIPTSGRETKTF